jgi:hypothetical protein
VAPTENMRLKSNNPGLARRTRDGRTARPGFNVMSAMLNDAQSTLIVLLAPTRTRQHPMNFLKSPLRSSSKILSQMH